MLKCHLVLLGLYLFVSLTSIRLISIRLHDAMSLSLTCDLDFENILRNCKYGDHFFFFFFWACCVIKLMEMVKSLFRTTKSSILDLETYYIVISYLLHNNCISPLCCAQRHIFLLLLLNCGWRLEAVCWTDVMPEVCEKYQSQLNQITQPHTSRWAIKSLKYRSYYLSFYSVLRCIAYIPVWEEGAEWSF